MTREGRRLYRGIALSFVVYEQQGREKDLPAYLAEIAVGSFNALEMRLDKFFGNKEITEATSVALRVDNHKMYTGYVDLELDDAARAPQAMMALGAAADRAKARDLELQGVVAVPLAGDRERNDDDVAHAIERILILAGSLQRRGLWLGLHNDRVESANDARIFRTICDAAAAHPNVVIAPDIEWLHRGGGNPAAFVAKYKERIKTLHLRQSRDGVWAEDFGEGDVDYRAVDKITRPLRTQDIYLIVELNHAPETKLTRRLVDDLKLSRQYIRKVFTV